MRYIIILVVLLLVSCGTLSDLKPSKQKDDLTISKHDKTKTKAPQALKQAYAPFYYMFLAMSAIGVIMLVLGIKSINKDYIVGGACMLALGILGPVLIYLALIALKIIMWTVGVAFFGGIAYIIWYMNKVRNDGDSHIEHLVQSFDDHKDVTWNEEASLAAELNTPPELHKKIQKIKGR